MADSANPPVSRFLQVPGTFACLLCVYQFLYTGSMKDSQLREARMTELYSAKRAGKELGTGSPNWLYDLIERYQVQPDHVTAGPKAIRLYYMTTIEALIAHHESEKRRRGPSRTGGKTGMPYAYRPLVKPARQDA